jgi:hypothetical protein
MSQEEIKKEDIADPTSKLKVTFATSGESSDGGLMKEVK